MSLHRRNSRANDFRKLTGVRLTDSRWRFQSVGAASCADRFGVAFRFLLNFFQVSWLYAPRTHAVFLEVWRTFERCPLPDPVQSVGWKLLNFQQFLPMGEEAVPLTMIHNAVGDVFRDPGKLGEFFGAGDIDIDFGVHCRCHGKTLDGRKGAQVG